ncbi:MAG: hypothetical protein AB7O96_14035 [Pseudobdellovibrionaceae bacterium]
MIIAALVLVGSVAYATEPAKKTTGHTTTPATGTATATAPTTVKFTKKEAEAMCVKAGVAEKDAAGKPNPGWTKCMQEHGQTM